MPGSALPGASHQHIPCPRKGAGDIQPPELIPALFSLQVRHTQGWNQGLHSSEAWIEKILTNLLWQNHPWAGSTEQAGTDTPAQVCYSLPGTQESAPTQESSPASTGNFPDIYHIFHTSSSTGAVSVVQHLQVWRDQAKSAVRSVLEIVLLRNKGKRGARILSQCSTTHFTECSLCSSQTHCAS